MLLLPQAASTLSSTLSQVFANTNQKDLETIYGLPQAEQGNLLDNLNRLEFVSSTMNGLTSHLTTKHEGGTHVKPTVRLPNSTPLVVQAAAKAVSAINFTPQMMSLMDTGTSLTPYGYSVVLDTNTPPIKLATHGRGYNHAEHNLMI